MLPWSHPSHGLCLLLGQWFRGRLYSPSFTVAFQMMLLHSLAGIAPPAPAASGPDCAKITVCFRHTHTCCKRWCPMPGENSCRGIYLLPGHEMAEGPDHLSSEERLQEFTNCAQNRKTKPKPHKLQSEHKNVIFNLRVFENWVMLPWHAMESPSVETFNTCLGMVLDNQTFNTCLGTVLDNQL